MYVYYKPKSPAIFSITQSAQPERKSTTASTPAATASVIPQPAICSIAHFTAPGSLF